MTAHKERPVVCNNKDEVWITHSSFLTQMEIHATDSVTGKALVKWNKVKLSHYTSWRSLGEEDV
jgi:hypothetical protein